MPSAGEIIRASHLGAGPWTVYTPQWFGSVSNPTMGNGTLTGVWCQIQKTVHFRIELTFGSTTTVGSGTYTFTLPTAAKSALREAVGQLSCFDTSAATVRLGACDLFGSTTEIAAFTMADTRLNNTTPFAWATGDTIVLSGTYEAA